MVSKIAGVRCSELTCLAPDDDLLFHVGVSGGTALLVGAGQLLGDVEAGSLFLTVGSDLSLQRRFTYSSSVRSHMRMLQNFLLQVCGLAKIALECLGLDLLHGLHADVTCVLGLSSHARGASASLTHSRCSVKAGYLPLRIR